MTGHRRFVALKMESTAPCRYNRLWAPVKTIPSFFPVVLTVFLFSSNSLNELDKTLAHAPVFLLLNSFPLYSYPCGRAVSSSGGGPPLHALNQLGTRYSILKYFYCTFRFGAE